MITKINVPKTSIVIEIENKEIISNKRNLFDLCGLKGELS